MKPAKFTLRDPQFADDTPDKPDPADETRLVLHRVPLDPKTHKDRGGRYYGPGPKLWFFVQPNGDIQGEVRAPTRSGAKAEILKLHPNARFAQ